MVIDLPVPPQGRLTESVCAVAVGQPVASTAAREVRDDASSVGGSVSAQGWDVEQDLVDQLSNHGLTANGAASASRAASIDSRTTASVHDAKGWESEDDWGEDDPPQRKPPPRAAPSMPDGAPLLAQMRVIFSLTAPSFFVWWHTPPSAASIIWQLQDWAHAFSCCAKCGIYIFPPPLSHAFGQPLCGANREQPDKL